MNAGVLHVAKGRCPARYLREGARSRSGRWSDPLYPDDFVRQGETAYSGKHAASRSWTDSQWIMNRRRKSSAHKPGRLGR